MPFSRCMDKQLYIHTMEWCSAIKNCTLYLLTTKDVPNVVLSELGNSSTSVFQVRPLTHGGSQISWEHWENLTWPGWI